MTKEKTEIVDLRLPLHLLEQLSGRTVKQALEQIWLDGFARGMEFGTRLVADTKKCRATKKRA